MLSKYSGQGLGAMLLDEFSEKVLDYKKIKELIRKKLNSCDLEDKQIIENYLNNYDDGLFGADIEELILKIDSNNKYSHRVVEKVGYEQVDNTTFRRGRM